MACRINTGVFLAVVGGKDSKRLGRVRSAPTGFPDIIGVQRREVEAVKQVSQSVFNPVEQRGKLVYGQAVAIEVKAVGGNQTVEQAAFEQAWTAMGGIYILARSVEDVLSVLGADSAPA